MNLLKSHLFSFVLVLLALNFTACSKKDSQPEPTKSENSNSIPEAIWPTDADIYFVGSITKDGPYAIPTVWKNGKPTTLFNTLNAAPNIFAKATAVTRANGKLYVVGSADVPNSSVAVVWEDGILKRLPTKSIYSEANAVTASGSDIYIAGMANNKPTLWKNGEEITLSTASGLATAVCVNGTDVYVSGITYNGRYSHATLWINGKLIPLDTDDSYSNNWANAMYVYGSDVYIAGSDDNKGSIMWKNSKSTVLFDSKRTISTAATDITVKNGDIYVSGYIETKTVVWKNGIATEMPLNDRNSVRNKLSIGFDGNDLYLSSGLQANSKDVAAILWRNNVAYQFSQDLSVINGMTIVPR